MSEQSRRFFFIFLGFLVLVVGAYFIFKNILPSSSRFVLSITDCSVEVEKELKVREGDELTLFVTSDSSGEFHIHGYDLMRELTADQEEKIVFKASNPGEYEYELEDDCVLGTIKVTDSEGNVPENVESSSTDEDHQESATSSADESHHNQ